MHGKSIELDTLVRLSRQPGFTLIELIIVMAIVGILVAIAYPGYREFVRDGRRADAKAALMDLASGMERYYSENLTYQNAASNDDTPRFFPNQVPLDGGRAYYELTIESADDESFTLRAEPINAQSGDGFLRLRGSGKRAWDRDDSGAITSPGEQCWQDTCS